MTGSARWSAMSDNNIFITGIGNGIGRALAIHYSNKGWRVAGLDPARA